MTYQKTPGAKLAQNSGASEEQIEAAARALACIEPGEDWPTNGELGGSLTGTRDDEYRDGMRDQARAALEAAAAASVSTSAHPTDERHDAEEREAESEDRIERAEKVVTRHLSRLSKRSDWAEDDTAIGGQASFIVRVLAEEGLIRATESEDHEATATATATGDREKLIDDVHQYKRVMFSTGQDYVGDVLERALDALAAPVEVSPDRIAEIIRRVEGKHSMGASELGEHIAEGLRGEGQ